MTLPLGPNTCSNFVSPRRSLLHVLLILMAASRVWLYLELDSDSSVYSDTSEGWVIKELERLRTRSPSYERCCWYCGMLLRHTFHYHITWKVHYLDRRRDCWMIDSRHIHWDCKQRYLELKYGDQWMRLALATHQWLPLPLRMQVYRYLIV
jgi:hypothetical protein